MLKGLAIVRKWCLVLGSICAIVYFVRVYSGNRVAIPYDKHHVELDHVDGDPPHSPVMAQSAPLNDPTLADLTVHVVTIACRSSPDALDGVKTLLKSAIALSNYQLMLHVIADDTSADALEKALSDWKWVGSFEYRILPPDYPPKVDSKIWAPMNEPCSTLKLFLPTILKDLDAVIFVHTDAIFLRPVEDLWNHFWSFSTQHMIGLAYDHRITEEEYVPEKKVIPYFIPSDADSAMMLMNLTRMREMGWTSHVTEMYNKYKHNPSLKIYAHQLLNSVLHFHPWRVYILDCDWNFRPPCWINATRSCPRAELGGVSLVHVPDRRTLAKDELIFKYVYDAYRNYDFDEGRTGMETVMEKAMAEFSGGVLRAGRPTIFYKHLRRM